MQRWIRAALIGSALLGSASAGGGQIAGTPSQAPPTIARDYELNFSNDFLGRGGAVDDFRTQQIVLTAWFANGWLALLDHSILTLGDANAAGRLDQLSGSLGYRLIDDTGPQRRNSLTLGAGFRSSGKFAGERMQNGFHRLVGSSVETLPYVATRRTDATVWLDAERYRLLQPASGSGWMSRWNRGYWVRGNTLLTSDGQWDAGLGIYAVASGNAIDLWLGLR